VDDLDGGDARLVLVGGRDPLDDIRNCPPPSTQRLLGSSDRFEATR
jgi:hypothetical protein